MADKIFLIKCKIRIYGYLSHHLLVELMFESEAIRLVKELYSGSLTLGTVVNTLKMKAHNLASVCKPTMFDTDSQIKFR